MLKYLAVLVLMILNLDVLAQEADVDVAEEVYLEQVGFGSDYNCMMLQMTSRQCSDYKAQRRVKLKPYKPYIDVAKCRGKNSGICTYDNRLKAQQKFEEELRRSEKLWIYCMQFGCPSYL